MQIELGVVAGAALLAAGAWYDLKNNQDIPAPLVQAFIFLGFIVIAMRWPPWQVLLQMLLSAVLVMYLSKKSLSIADSIYMIGGCLFIPQASLFFITLTAAFYKAVSAISGKKQNTFVPFILAAYLVAASISLF